MLKTKIIEKYYPPKKTLEMFSILQIYYDVTTSLWFVFTKKRVINTLIN